MGDFKIKMNVSICNDSDPSQDVIVSVGAEFDEETLDTIDGLEQSLLSVNREALSQTLSQKLEEVSKKKHFNSRL
jgi:hypothetical protein